MISPRFGPANVVRHGMLTIISPATCSMYPAIFMTERGEAILEQIIERNTSSGPSSQ